MEEEGGRESGVPSLSEDCLFTEAAGEILLAETDGEGTLLVGGGGEGEGFGFMDCTAACRAVREEDETTELTGEGECSRLIAATVPS